MKKLIPYIVALSSACLFFACGDDTSSKNDSGLSTVGNVSELPECEAANAGQMIYVADSGAVFFCNTTFWKNLSGNNGIDGINGTDGAGCIAVPNKDEFGQNISYSVMCDGNLIGTLQNGNDGASCIAEEVVNGYAIICDGVSVGVLQHGTNGTSCTAIATTTGFDVICADKLIGSLTNGAKGDKGDPGDKGDTGDGCSIIAKTNTLGNYTGEYTVTCGKSTVTLKDGLKGDSGENCTIADEIDEDNNKTGNYTLTCDGKTVTVKNGNDGESCTAVPTTDKNGKEDGKGFVIMCGNEEKGTILNGAKGDTGDGCSVEAIKDEDGKLTGEYTVTCGNSTITLKDGLKGDSGESCTVADELDEDDNKTGNYTLTCGDKTVTVKNGEDATITDQSKQELLDWFTEYDTTVLSTCAESNVNEIKNEPISNRIGITISYWKCTISDEVYNWVESNQADYEAYIASPPPNPDPDPELDE